MQLQADLYKDYITKAVFSGANNLVYFLYTKVCPLNISSTNNTVHKRFTPHQSPQVQLANLNIVLFIQEIHIPSADLIKYDGSA